MPTKGKKPGLADENRGLKAKVKRLEKNEQKLKCALLALREKEEITRKLTMASRDAVLITDLDDNITYLSERAVELFGYKSQSDMLGRTCVEFVSPEDRARALGVFKRALREGFVSNEEFVFLKTGGARFSAQVNSAVIKDRREQAVAVLMALSDLTKSKNAEMEIRESEETFRGLIDASPDSIFILDNSGRIIYLSEQALSVYGGNDISRVIGRAIYDFVLPDDRERAAAVLADIAVKSSVHGREMKLLRHNGARMTGEANGSIIKAADDRVKGSILVIRDITEKKKTEQELKNSYMAVKKVMDGIINAMEKLVEKKDLYTVGHQHRTAELARAIALKMGLASEQVTCVHISALIHDIGKIFVSGAILNKVGPLTPEEYGVIKKHPEAGFEVLKTIDFPWPIADIILQHHERLDGSGYPYGLKEDGIYLESRIISVADVVEAITFARPYRPAFGIDKALQEIESNSGKLFDPEVVEITSHLLRSGEFKFVV